MIRVLVVEDEALTAEAHGAYIGRLEGFEVAGTCPTGSAALRTLRDGTAGRVDLVLLDVNLPDTTGIELCRTLRAAGVETDVIAVTAVRDAATVRSAVALGIVQYLIKPFSFAAFAEKLGAYQAFRERIDRMDLTDQQEVDSGFAALRRDPRLPLPKGLSAETLDGARQVLRGRSPDGLSASELAEELSVSRVTARRYLEHLADAGIAERATRHGAPGRPEVEYRAKVAGPR